MLFFFFIVLWKKGGGDMVKLVSIGFLFSLDGYLFV